MTTIVYTNGVLATDSQISSNSIIASTSYKKIHQLNNDSYVACSGSSYFVEDFVNWLNGGEKPVFNNDSEFYALVVDKDGNAFEYNKQLRRKPAEIPYCDGSGFQLAYAALDCGKNAIEAVEIACKRDIYSSFPVQSVVINEQKNGNSA